MSIQFIGGEGVSQAAYDYVKSQNFDKSSSNELFKDLASKYTNLNFGIGTQLGGQGLNNISIAPNILQKMATDPATREKYEAILYDMNELAKNPQTTDMFGGKIVASGFMINADGTTGGWAMSQSGDEKVEKSFIEKMLEELEKKRKELESKGQNKDFLLDVKI